jgi:hypothetical protein
MAKKGTPYLPGFSRQEAKNFAAAPTRAASFARVHQQIVLCNADRLWRNKAILLNNICHELKLLS